MDCGLVRTRHIRIPVLIISCWILRVELFHFSTKWVLRPDFGNNCLLKIRNISGRVSLSSIFCHVPLFGLWDYIRQDNLLHKHGSQTSILGYCFYIGNIE
uniref:Uncharacterized protein n=1 Tax=Cacopsylla melanoneura TaxID=428564 RepID=A0A8D8UV91_9HEMI